MARLLVGNEWVNFRRRYLHASSSKFELFRSENLYGEVHFSIVAFSCEPNSHIIFKNYPFIRLGNHVTIEGKSKMIITNTKVLITKGNTP